MSAQIALLRDGRLHLQHGPIDCLCRAWGDAAEVARAYAQAAAAFPSVLPALCADMAMLRAPIAPRPTLTRRAARGTLSRGAGEGRLTGAGPSSLSRSAGEGHQPAGLEGEGQVAGAMHAACAPFADRFITPMAAVAGAVADYLLAAMAAGRRLERAFINDGGDIAFYLAPGQSLRCGLVADLAAPALHGAFLLRADDPSRGLATSGRACKGQGGRSFSLGIADAVTVLARTAAMADAAATVIANAVDLPGHPAIARRPACALDPDSDLGALLVTWTVGTLTAPEVDAALAAGRACADELRARGLIDGAVLALRGRLRTPLPVPAPPRPALPCRRLHDPQAAHHR